MADYYTNWSVALKLSTDADTQSKEVAWLKEVLEVPEALFGASNEEIWAYFVNRAVQLPVVVDGAGDLIENWPEFGWALHLDERADGPHLWAYSEDQGNLEHLFAVVQGFLCKFYPDNVFGMEWSYTCSKPRLDAYGGGAAVVTPTEIHMLNTCDWLEKKKEQLTAKSEGNGGAG